MSTALKWKLAAGFLLVFIAGVVTGGMLNRVRVHHILRSRPLAQHMGERLRSELGLTPEQFQKVSPIIDQTANNLQTIRKETAQRVRQTIADGNEQMRPLLTPEQQAKLTALEQKHRRHRDFRSAPPPPPGKPPP